VNCTKCGASLEASDIKPYLVIESATEIRIACKCGTDFYAFVQHSDWFEASAGDNVDLGHVKNPEPTKRRRGGAS